MPPGALSDVVIDFPGKVSRGRPMDSDRALREALRLPWPRPGFPPKGLDRHGPAPSRSSDGAAAPSGSWSCLVRDTSDQETRTI